MRANSPRSDKPDIQSYRVLDAPTSSAQAFVTAGRDRFTAPCLAQLLGRLGSWFIAVLADELSPRSLVGLLGSATAEKCGFSRVDAHLFHHRVVTFPGCDACAFVCSNAFVFGAGYPLECAPVLLLERGDPGSGVGVRDPRGPFLPARGCELVAQLQVDAGGGEDDAVEVAADVLAGGFDTAVSGFAAQRSGEDGACFGDVDVAGDQVQGVVLPAAGRGNVDGLRAGRVGDDVVREVDGGALDAVLSRGVGEVRVPRRTRRVSMPSARAPSRSQIRRGGRGRRSRCRGSRHAGLCRCCGS